MVHLLSIVQITLAILLTALILVQRANTDASGAFGADGGSGATLEKRGGEKTLHRMTIVVATLFAITLAVPLFLAH
jgi:protein translocase SecG subunit